MSTDLKLSCTCGAVRATARAISGKKGNHAVCYCDDCQAFAHFLNRPDHILDRQGGTQIFQMSPASISMESGADRLACMRLGPRGLYRWYTNCCNTPIGNTLPTGQLPFVGLIHLCIQRPVGDDSLEKALGPVRVRAYDRFAKGDPEALPPCIDSIGYSTMRVMGFILKWRLRGDHRRSPFFEASTGNAVAVPRVLNLEERDKLRQQLTSL